MSKINLSPTSRNVAFTSSFEHRGNYYFYDKRTASSKPNLYQEILKTADSCIWILDPYFNENADWQLFKDLSKEDLTIEIVTTLKDGKTYKQSSCADMFAASIINGINPSVVKGKVKVFYYNQSAFDLWHDRFLVIDNKKAYLVGASMSNQLDTNVSFGIYDIPESEKDTFNLIKEKFLSYRSGASGNKGNVFSKNRPEKQNSGRRR